MCIRDSLSLEETFLSLSTKNFASENLALNTFSFPLEIILLDSLRPLDKTKKFVLITFSELKSNLENDLPFF